MNKKEALQILIQNSYLLNQQSKMDLLASLSELSNEEIDAIGKFLALEKKLAIEQAPQLEEDIATALQTTQE